MSTLLRKIRAFAVLSRLTLLLFQAVSNLLIPDHDAGVFNPTIPTGDISTIADRFVNYLLGGLQRWDAIYFTHVSQYGYTYENCLAFFPLYPFVVQIIAQYLLFPFHVILSTYCLTLIAATLLNLVLFVKTAENIFHLGQIVMKNDVIAYKAALLFCINPASIFMSAPYSETLFLFLTTAGMLNIESNKMVLGACLFGLSCAARSNGLLSIGYLLYKFLKEFTCTVNRLRKGMTTNLQGVLVSMWIIVTHHFVPYFVLVLLVLLPFVLYQYYCYTLFCVSESAANIPQHLLEHGRLEGFKMAGDGDIPVWCASTVPLAYSYIQKQYWNQGLFNYWEFKQIPNFLLATPVSILTLAAAVTYYRHNRYTCLTLGLDDPGSTKKCPPTSTVYHPTGPKLLPYLVHAVILTVFGWFCIHVQVLTRLLFSSCPVLYWHAAYLISEDTLVQEQLNKYDVLRVPKTTVEREENVQKLLSNLVTNQIHKISAESLRTKCVLLYFLGYFVIGTVMFSNFLPWT